MYYKQIYINSNNYGNVNFQYSYNDNSTFFDLLEFLAYNSPNLNICPCYKIQYYNNYNNYNNDNYIYLTFVENNNLYNYQNSYTDVDMSKNVQSFFNSYQNYIIFYKKGKCICNEIFKNNFKKSKIQILNILSEYHEKINKLENEKMQLNNYLYNFEKENKNLNNNLNTLKKEKENLNNNVKVLEYENQKLNNNLNILNNEKQKLNYNVKSLENERLNLEKMFSQFLDKDKSLENKNESANKEIKELNLKIKNFKSQISNYEAKIYDLTRQLEGLINERRENVTLNKETNFIDFYDVIIDIKSIKDINTGWKIKMSEKAKQNYENYKKEENLKIGIIGNANKGKSFILSKMSKISLPSGTSIRTEGLSIKYPELEKFKDRKIVLLDSAGLETPILKDLTTQFQDGEEIKEKEFFREKSREKLITELFLQNYIINNSDILIIVVGILTYSEQKLLNRIKTEFIKKNKKIDKPLFIIHNLMTYETIAQVEEYIDDCLLKSATFDLKKGHNISTKEDQKNGIYYTEKNSNQKIFHLIFARENSDAGNHYNEFTLEFLEKSYQNVINLKSYDVIESLKDNFIEISKDILEKTEKPLDKENFDKTNNDMIKLTNANFALKKCLIDELGFSNLKANSFEPTYNCYKKDNKLIIKIESPGNSTLKSHFEHEAQYNIIKINGIKKKDKEPENLNDNIYNFREYGPFSLDILLNPEEFIIQNKKPKTYQKLGVLVIEYDLEDKNDGGELIIDDEL